MGKTSGDFLPESGLIDLEYMFEWNEVYPIMQYTGLKDKNGKEIYEGDIVQYNYHSCEKCGEERKKIGEIIFEKGSFKTSFPTFSDFKEFEVIGNVYENSNLLDPK